jgi:predicted nucleic acid-binding protein
MPARFLDTNILLRYFTRDDPAKLRKPWRCYRENPSFRHAADAAAA